MITLTTTYKETLPSEIVEVIDYLVEEGQLLEDVLSTLDYFGEEYYDNIERIIEVLDDTYADRSELYDFVEEYGVDKLEHFEKYKELRDDYDPDAVDAFISLYDVSYLGGFEEAYEGQFDSVEQFVDYYMEAYDVEIPSWVCTDTWNCSLRFNYNEKDGYYFRFNW